MVKISFVEPTMFKIRNGQPLSTTPYVSENGSLVCKRCSREQARKDLDVFLKNAFFFYSHRERIYSDSRLFLSRVPINTDMGSMDDHNATLGAYLEMWEYEEMASIMNEDGSMKLLVEVSGSPLSGSCSLFVVDEKGEGSTIRTGSFSKYIKMICSYHDRYRKLRENSWSYSLNQVLDILKAEEKGDKRYEQTLRLSVLQLQVRQLAKKQQGWNDKVERLTEELHETRMQWKSTQLLDYIERKKQYEKSIEEELNELHERKLAIKREYAGKHNSKEFQEQYVPVKHKIRELKQSIENFDLTTLRRIWPWGKLTKNNIENLLEEAEYL